MSLRTLSILVSFLTLADFAVAQDPTFELRTGDLLFQQSDCGPFCDAINKVTEGINGIDFNHVGILAEDESGDQVVLEAVSEGVKETPLAEFLRRTVDNDNLPKVCVGRIRNLSGIDLNAISRKKSNYLGKKYDEVFDIENDSYYCSELVYYLYVDKSGNSIFELAPMTFVDPETGKTFKIWKDYFKDLDHEVPEGQPGLNPGGISRSAHLEIFFPYSDFQ